MFLVVLLGLAATAAALPTSIHEAAKENEGVNIPVYKPWYNPYGFNIFESNFLKPDRNKIYGDYPNSMFNMYKPYSPEYMFGFIHGFMNGINKYDYTTRPYSHDYWEYFNRFNPYFYYPEYMKSRNMFRPSQSYANKMDYMHYPYYEYMNNYDNMYKPYYSEFFKNTHRNKEGYNYPYKPNFQGYPPNFADMSYPNYNTDFKNNMPNPFYENYDYMYRPYSPEYMDGFKENTNMKYPYYKYDFPENIVDFMNNYMNKVYSFYNNLFGRENYMPFGFPDYFGIRPKREMTGVVVENEPREELIRQSPVTEELQQPQAVDQPVARSRRDVEVATPEMTTDDVAVGVVPETDLVGKYVKGIRSVGPTDQEPQENVVKANYVPYDIPHYDPHYTTYPYYRAYTYQPWWNNAYYYNK